MNIGNRVKFLVGCAGNDFIFSENDIVETTKNNIDFLENQVNAGHAIELLDEESLKKRGTTLGKASESESQLEVE